jgi:hypothetical protein
MKNHGIFYFISRAFSIENGVGTTSEIIEHTTSAARLLNELQRVKEDLKNKDIEIRRAYEIRENTDREIEDLTSSLFEVILSKRNCFRIIFFVFLVSTFNG